MKISELEELAIVDIITVAKNDRYLKFNLYGDGKYYYEDLRSELKTVFGDKEIKKIDAYDNEIYIYIV